MNNPGSMKMALMMACSVLVSIPSCTQERSGHAGFYISRANGFSIVFPEDWRINEGDGEILPVVEAISPLEEGPDKFAEYMSVDVEDLDRKTGLKEYFLRLRGEQIDEATYFEEIERGEISISGERAMYMLFDMDTPDAYLRVLQYFFVNGGKGYLISCVAESTQFPKHRTEFEETARTFQLK